MIDLEKLNRKKAPAPYFHPFLKLFRFPLWEKKLKFTSRYKQGGGGELWCVKQLTSCSEKKLAKLNGNILLLVLSAFLAALISNIRGALKIFSLVYDRRCKTKIKKIWPKMFNLTGSSTNTNVVIQTLLYIVAFRF